MCIGTWVFTYHYVRSATVKKFIVGYEMFGSPQRDITAEKAAYRLKRLNKCITFWNHNTFNFSHLICMKQRQSLLLKIQI